MKKCIECEFYKSMRNKAKGVKIPNGFGKCIRSEGVCEDHKPNEGIGGKTK